ncbi:MAG TPA: Smr/MutS family protein [Polyangiales bacterium]|nr:Smr/MutS family protein [Polyangiales bacterium]
MSRKRKRSRDAQQQAADSAPKPIPQVATALGAVLKKAGVTATPPAARKGARPPVPMTLRPPDPQPLERVTAPPKAAGAGLTTTELRMLNDAYEGARPLQAKNARAKPVGERAVAGDAASGARQRALADAQDRAEELSARSRLAALVSEGVRFKIRREDDYVEGVRADTSAKLLDRIRGKGFTPEASLDLHGLRVNQVGPAIERFVRSHQRRGARHVLLIVGKGLHSEAGVSMLGPAAIDALSSGLAAPWVIAFASAHTQHGGNGALAVLLRD